MSGRQSPADTPIAVDGIDETVINDGELLEWFNTRNWFDLSIALSMALRVNVDFPDREDLPDANPTDPFTMFIYEVGEELEYPLRMEEFVERALTAYDDCDCLQSWQSLEDSVEDIEGVRVRVGRKPFAPYSRWEDLCASHYSYRRAAPAGWTVAHWRKHRLQGKLPTYATLEVFYPDGTVVPGQTRMSTVRRAWEAVDPLPRPDPKDAHRQFTFVRDARWFGHVRTITGHG